MNQSNPENREIDLVQLDKMARVNRQVINRLKERVSILENALALTCDDPQMAWLYRNRSERMDATVELFSKARAAFHLARYEFAAQFVDGKSVADLACGTGFGVRYLAEQGKAANVTGVDLCEQAIQYANAKHCVQACSFVAADATDTSLPPESFDVVTSFETIEHVDDDGALIAEFARILKPGGMLICSTPNQWPLEIAPHHVRVYDRKSFTKVLSGSFDIQSMHNQNSGSDFKYNHQQPAGITPTTDDNQDSAECFLAVALRK